LFFGVNGEKGSRMKTGQTSGIRTHGKLHEEGHTANYVKKDRANSRNKSRSNIMNKDAENSIRSACRQTPGTRMGPNFRNKDRANSRDMDGANSKKTDSAKA
jgi:hypothetical protein